MRGDGVDHIDRREALGLQGVQVEVDLDLALLAAVGIGGMSALEVASWVRMLFWPRSLSCCSFKPCPESPSCRIGHAGGVVLDDERRRGARREWRRWTWLMAVTWATALPMLTWGWKKILMRPMPLSDCDSMCSMSLTVVVMPRSLLVTMRLDISCADSPV